MAQAILDAHIETNEDRILEDRELPAMRRSGEVTDNCYVDLRTRRDVETVLKQLMTIGWCTETCCIFTSHAGNVAYTMQRVIFWFISVHVGIILLTDCADRLTIFPH